MVHYIRFLKTARVRHRTSKVVSVNALITVTTDLGDTFMFSDATLTTCLVLADNPKHILCRARSDWLQGFRELSLDVSAHVGQGEPLLRLHLFHDEASNCIPSILDVWSAPFRPLINSRAAPLVERQFSLPDRPGLGIWEETGNSIARHIW